MSRIQSCWPWLPCLALPLPAVAAEPETRQMLQVATRLAPPLAIKTDAGWEGITTEREPLNREILRIIQRPEWIRRVAGYLGLEA